MRSCSRRSEGGYILLALGLAIVVVMGAAGLAIDLGRMYVAKNETQSFTDAAAVAATLELNGTVAGIGYAQAAVAGSANRWNFGSNTFSNAQVLFAQDKDGPWDPNPANPSGFRFVSVDATVDVPMSFMRALASGPTSAVRARSVAGQVLQTSFREGLFPFSPFAHADPATQLPGADPVSGLTPGLRYTLRYGASLLYQVPHTHCPGDHYQEIIDIAKAGGGEERGFIESTSADVLRQTIVYDYQTVYREVGDSVVMTGGAIQTLKDALVERIRQDSDREADTYAEYFNNGVGTGNGRRLVAAPINLGEPGGYQIVQIGAFFLLDEEHYLAAAGGNKAFCAEYVGAYVQGSRGPGAGGPGYYVVRLVE